MSYGKYRNRAIREQADRMYDAVIDGHCEAVAEFAEYLAGEGTLGLGVESFRVGMTVGDLVDAYLKDYAGRAELSRWAREGALDEYEAYEESQVA